MSYRAVSSAMVEEDKVHTNMVSGRARLNTVEGPCHTSNITTSGMSHLSNTYRKS